MKVLVTGGLGGIGRYVSKLLMDSGMDVTIFDQNRKKAKLFPKERVVLGDITDPDMYRDLLPNLDAVIHLAFLVMPQIDTHPRAYEINVEGTRTLIKELEQSNPNCRFIFSSSVAVFGPTAHLTPPITLDQPLNPDNTYSKHKVECEELIKRSNLRWVILRFTLAPYIEVSLSGESAGALFATPSDQRIEFVHVKDVSLACKNALTADCLKQTFIIGGGPSCQMTYYNMIEEIFKVFHLLAPSREKFGTSPIGGDWYNTTRSQELLQYQNHNFEDYINDVRKGLGVKKTFFWLFSPISKLYMKRLFEKL